MWCIPPDHDCEFVAAMEDVLEVYKRPANQARPVVCLDESSKQLVGEIRTPLPAAPGAAARYDCEYVRNGTANLFMAFEPLAGWRHVEVTDARRRVDWAWFVKGLLDGRYKDAERVVLVMDQLNTHGPWSLYEAFPPDEAKRIAARLEIHHTPKHGSCRTRRTPISRSLRPVRVWGEVVVEHIAQPLAERERHGLRIQNLGDIDAE